MKFATAESLLPLASLKTSLGVDGDLLDDELEAARGAAIRLIEQQTWRPPLTRTASDPIAACLPTDEDPLVLPFSWPYTSVDALKGWEPDTPFGTDPDRVLSFGRTERTGDGLLSVYPRQQWPNDLGGNRQVRATVTADWDFEAEEAKVMQLAIRLLVRSQVLATGQRDREYSRMRALEALAAISAAPTV